MLLLRTIQGAYTQRDEYLESYQCHRLSQLDIHKDQHKLFKQFKRGVPMNPELCFFHLLSSENYLQ